MSSSYDKLFSLEIKLGDIDYENNLSDDLRLDRTNLEQEMITHTQKFAYYATIAALAKSRRDHMKHRLEMLEARLDFLTRQEAQMSGTKMTEKMVGNQVITHPEYQVAYQEYLKTCETSDYLEVAKEAMRHRRDMIRELNNLNRGSSLHDSVMDEHIRSSLTTNKKYNKGE